MSAGNIFIWRPRRNKRRIWASAKRAGEELGVRAQDIHRRGKYDGYRGYSVRIITLMIVIIFFPFEVTKR